jgi:predicted Zn-dependent peptidase
MQYRKTTLDNGLRVITVPMKDNPTVTVLVLVATGSKYETKRENGISHFLEHMCFKGTEKRPTARTISSELDALGSQYNAFTGQEYTGYYAKSDAKHFKQIFDVVSDIYLHSTFPEKEIEKEKGVIVEEINMYEDMPLRHVHDLFMGLLYGDQPAGWNIAGTRENVRAFTREDFVRYHNAHYVPEATTVVVAGQVDEESVLAEVLRIFGQKSKGNKESKLKVIEAQTKPEILLQYKATDQTHLVIGVRTFDIYDARNPILTVLAAILGGGMSSRLFEKLREEMGSAYYVRAENDAYTDHGVFAVSAGVTNGRVTEVIEGILGECALLAKESVSDEELSKVKEYLSGTMKLELESSDAWASFYGGQEVLNREIHSPEKVEQEIRAVTKEQVQEMAKLLFTDANLNAALIGPFKDNKHFLESLTFLR